MTPMKIVMIASECVPYVKTGGLADVVGALPKVLKALGHDVIVILPRYAAVDGTRYNLRQFLSPMGVWMGNAEEWCSVYLVGYPDSLSERDRIPVYFIKERRKTPAFMRGDIRRKLVL